MRGRRVARSGLVALALAVVLVGCAEPEADGPGPVDPPGNSGRGAGEDVGTPARPGEPLLQIDEGGGFTMPGFDFATVPYLTVYADGRAIVHGPQILIWPPPALPNLLQVQLSEADVAAIVDEAIEAGLIDAIPEYGWPMIADMPTTTVAVTVDGVRYVHAANALGMGEEGALPGDDLSLDAIGLTEEEVEARAALSGFIGTALEIVTGTGGEDLYPITGFAVRAWPAVDLGGEVDGIDIQVLDWPLDLALESVSECVVIDGADAGVLLDVLTDANTLTEFEQDGVTYQVFFRALLPHETTCDDVE